MHNSTPIFSNVYTEVELDKLTELAKLAKLADLTDLAELAELVREAIDGQLSSDMEIPPMPEEMLDVAFARRCIKATPQIATHDDSQTQADQHLAEDRNGMSVQNQETEIDLQPVSYSTKDNTSHTKHEESSEQIRTLSESVPVINHWRFLPRPVLTIAGLSLLLISLVVLTLLIFQSNVTMPAAPLNQLMPAATKGEPESSGQLEEALTRLTGNPEPKVLANSGTYTRIIRPNFKARFARGFIQAEAKAGERNEQLLKLSMTKGQGLSAEFGPVIYMLLSRASPFSRWEANRMVNNNEIEAIRKFMLNPEVSYSFEFAPLELLSQGDVCDLEKMIIADFSRRPMDLQRIQLKWDKWLEEQGDRLPKPLLPALQAIVRSQSN